jgi:hypothetical protein
VSEDLSRTEGGFASIHNYNFNKFIYELSQEKCSYPEVLKEDARIIYGQDFKYHSKEVSALVKEQYPLLFNS